MSSPTRESGFESMFMQKGDGLRPRSPSSSSSPPSRRSPTMEKSTDNDDGDVPAEVITVKDFFDFMKTAYQVYEHLDDGDEDDGTKINWDELTKLTVLNHVIDQQERDLLTQTAVAEPNIKYNSKSDTVLLSKSESRTSKRYSCSELEGKGRMTSLPREARVEMLGIWTEANLNCKLNDVINEGILDSILPYLIGYRKPSKTSSVYHPIIKKVSSMNDVKKPASFGTFVEEKASRDRLGRRKSLVAAIEAEHQNQKQDGDVEIHVCDEVKGMKKDFRCPQKLLVSKMGYFADVTAGQRLEDMDISVHCDIQIFDWLMRWVKRDSILVADWPLLDPHNCVPILVSASFLQMEPLLHDCLMYCHTHMSEIVKTATNLACLSDALLTRLAAMYTNVELESLKDRKDKIQSRLYCKMIMSLSEPVPESLRGHYSTLATLFKCTKCNKLLGRHVAEQVPCQPGSMRVDRRGNVVSAHSKDVTWSLNEYISWLYGELRSWRRVYWRLWADCHFLRCQLCDTYFPAYQMEWCSHHEQAAVMLCVDGRGALAAGRYPCCGERAYRFEAITRNTGCQFREHAPDEYLATDGAVLDIYNKFRDIIAMRPPQLMFPERLTKLVQRDTITDASGRLQCKEVFWWEGIQLAPPRAPLGLLGKLYTSNNKFNPRLAPAPAASVRPASATPAIVLPAGTVASPEPDKKPLKEKESKQKKGVPAGGDSPEDCGEQTSSDSERSSASARSDEDKPPRRRVQRQARVASSPSCKRGRAAGRQWAACASARSNQDQQRRFEERAARQMRQALAKRAHLLPPAKPRAPTGGAYARLEAEWRERHATRARSAAPPAGAGAAARQRMLPSHKYKS